VGVTHGPPAATQTRHNRTITVDFHDEATYVQRLDDGKACIELVIAFLLALGFELKHKATYEGGRCLTRHSHYVRIRLGELPIWRLQCTTCRAVCTVLPHFVLRSRSKVGEYPHQTECSTCTSSPWVAFDEQEKHSTTSSGGRCFFPFLLSFFIPSCNHPLIIAASSS